MPQDLIEIQVEQPQKKDDYQEYPELENLDGFRFEADIYVLTGHSVSFKIRDVQVRRLGNLSMAPALVPVAGKNALNL